MYHRIEAAASPSTYLGADRASIGDRLARLTSSVEGMLSFLAQHDSQKAIHDIRVAARRLRVALRNLKRKLPRRERRRCMKALLEITNSCRAARDADVRQHLVEIWLSRAGLEDHEQGQLLLAMAVQDTEAARHELRRRMNAPKWSHVLWNFRQSAAALVVDDSSDDGFLRDVLSHQRRRLRRGLRKQRNTRKPRRLHRLRLRIKDARYFVEDFGPLAGAAVEGELTKLRELQNALGDFHDEWCLRKWLRKQYKCYLATGAIRELLKVNERKLLKRIRRLGKKAV